MGSKSRTKGKCAELEVEQVWADIPGYEGIYQASSLGCVRSVDRRSPSHGPQGDFIRKSRGRVLHQSSDDRGRRRVMLVRGRTRTTMFVHVAVLSAFAGSRPPGMVACHNDGDCSNNRVENLRWDTQAANEADKIKHGTRRFGEEHHNSRLTKPQVDLIRRLVGLGVSQRDVARLFRTCQSNVSLVVRGKTWSD